MKRIVHSTEPGTRTRQRRLVTIEGRCADVLRDLGPESVDRRRVHRGAGPSGGPLMARYLLFEAMLRCRSANDSLGRGRLKPS